MFIKDIRFLGSKDIENFVTLYEDAFPHDERRDTNELINHSDEKYIRCCVFYENTFVGIVCFWKLNKIIYIEYIALVEGCRGKGLGKQIISHIMNNNKEYGLVLEIEPVIQDEYTMKRYSFYKNIGFDIIDKNYIQPAYSKEKQSIPLWLMGLNTDLNKEDIIKDIYKNVYNV